MGEPFCRLSCLCVALHLTTSGLRTDGMRQDIAVSKDLKTDCICTVASIYVRLLSLSMQSMSHDAYYMWPLELQQASHVRGLRQWQYNMHVKDNRTFLQAHRNTLLCYVYYDSQSSKSIRQCSCNMFSIQRVGKDEMVEMELWEKEGVQTKSGNDT